MFVVLRAVFRLIVVLFCVMCVIGLLCLIVNHCHRVKTHLQLKKISLHYIILVSPGKTWKIPRLGNAHFLPNLFFFQIRHFISHPITLPSVV
jgi:hypothetical protein